MDWLVFGVYATLVMLALWPRYRTGLRFLRRWHVPEPDDEQIAAAVRYLRDRRLPIVPLMLLAPLVTTAVGVPVRPHGGGALPLFMFLGALLAALLLAESLAGLRRPRGAIRSAPLVRRRARDLVPGYAWWLLAALTVITIGAALAGLAAQPAVDRALDRLPPNQPRPDGSSGVVLADDFRADLARAIGWPVVLGAALVVLLVLAVVWRATARPADRDERIDLVLRVRSARVAVGTGIALTAALGVAAVERFNRVQSFLSWQPTAGSVIFGDYPSAGPAFPDDPGIAPPGWVEVWANLNALVGLVVLLTGLIGWVWVANPPVRLPAARAA